MLACVSIPPVALVPKSHGHTKHNDHAKKPCTRDHHCKQSSQPAASLPKPATASEQHSPSAPSNASSSMSLALEISGNVNRIEEFVETARGREEVMTRAAAAGWTVAVFCVLDARNDTLQQLREEVSRFEARLSTSSRVVNCKVADEAEGIFDGNGGLRPEHRAAHPDYPYPRRDLELGPGPPAHLSRPTWPDRVRNSLRMFHKLWLVGELRRRSGLSFDVVWRMRPDTVGTGKAKPELDLQVLRVLRELGHSHARASYVVPKFPEVASGLHTDMEALLPTSAADRYDRVWHELAGLYARGTTFHPEKLVVKNMQAGGFKFRASDALVLHKCTWWRLGHHGHLRPPVWPCRELLSFDPTSTSKPNANANGNKGPAAGGFWLTGKKGLLG